MGATAAIVTAVSTGAEVGFGFMQHQQAAQAASMRGRFENQIAERNAQLAEMQGEDALNLGQLAENRQRGQTTQAVASGRAAAAGQGIDINTGSAAAVRVSQELVGEIDALTIRNNAARQAWGYDVEAAHQRMQGRLALLGGENEAATERLASVGTLLTGAASLYGLRNTRVPKKSGNGRAALPVGQRANDSMFGPNRAPV